jgi:uncharacterized surface protein with fasciclin (FAS1) repeats
VAYAISDRSNWSFEAMNPNRRTLATALAVLSFAVLAGCASTPAPTDIADTIARTPELATLNRLVGEAGLGATLHGPGPYTVFAPSDEAFRSLPANKLAELTADKELLKSVLSYHLLPGRTAAADVKAGPAKTVQGANLALARAGTYVTVDDAVVQRADVAATNGVIQIIDRVLIPPKK